jgi:hypothetical protein
MKTTNTDPRIVQDVKEVLNRLIKAEETGDIGMFAACFAHDESLVHFGTDADELWYNWNDFLDFAETQLKKRKGTAINFKDTTVHHNAAGDTAWYSQLVDRCPETKGDDVSIEGFRHTGVMEKRNGKWVIVQSHISLPYHG